MNDLIYTVKEASKILKCNVGYVYELIRCGRLHAIKLGSMKVLKSSLLAFLNEHEGLDLTHLYDVKPIQVGIIKTNERPNAKFRNGEQYEQFASIQK